MQKVDLTSSQNKILGPIGLFMWTCLVLKWKIQTDFQVEVAPGILLHLLHTPRKRWHVLSIKDGGSMRYASSCQKKKGNPFVKAEVSSRTWQSMWARHKALPPLSLESRAFGLVTSSAIARIQDSEQATCDLCNGANPGQIHIATECPALSEIRDLPKYHKVRGLPVFTRCSGIPCTAPNCVNSPRIDPSPP